MRPGHPGITGPWAHLQKWMQEAASHRHVRSSGPGCPAASGIVSLRGREQGAAGSWGTLGSESRRPCLPTHEALTASLPSGL